MKLIQTQTLTSTQPSITFSSIPQNFTALVVKMSARGNNASVSLDCRLTVNSITSGYSGRALNGQGTVPNSYVDDPTGDKFYYLFTLNGANATSNTFGNAEIYIPNYAGSTNKSFSFDSVDENNATFARSTLSAGLLSNTAAISSLTFAPGGDSFVAGTTISLYGIGGAGDPGIFAPKATGGTISLIGGYYVHTFTASGTFVPTADLTNVEYLVVAGGGGGGYDRAGGGGAGGYRSSVVGQSSGGGASAESTLTLTAGTNYTVTIGAGGAGATSNVAGSDGVASVFSTISANGGGGGGPGFASELGRSGGSGGGTGGQSGGLGLTGGAGTTNQGFAGGNGDGSNNSGGGGGASAAGASGSTGIGGAGVSSNVTGSTITRAGGGGGAAISGGSPGRAGGSGGGGASGWSGGAPIAGTVNTGGGGGGGGQIGDNRIGGAGGSGIVVVRYLA